MCLAIPGRITALHRAPGDELTADVEYPGLTKRVGLLYLPEAKVGDYVLVHAGFGIRLLTESEAREVVEALEQAAALTGEEARDRTPVAQGSGVGPS